MESKHLLKKYRRPLIAGCLFALAIVYIFQRVDYWYLLTGASAADMPFATFAFNRALRMILNDLICFFLILVLFQERKYLRVAVVVFCAEFFLILPLYLIIKLRLEGSSEISSPLLSQIHRLIVNPMLMLLLIVAFYYQRLVSSQDK